MVYNILFQTLLVKMDAEKEEEHSDYLSAVLPQIVNSFPVPGNLSLLQAAEEEVNAIDNQDRRNYLHVSALVRNDVHVSAPVRNDLHVFAPVRNDVHVSAPVRNDLHVFAPVRNDVHVFAPAAEDVSSSTAITPRLDVAGGHQVQVILLRQAVIPSNQDVTS